MPCCDWIADSAARRSRYSAAVSNSSSLGGLLHLAGELLLHRPAAAGQEVGRLAHQLGVAGEIDLAGAGAGAALDLVQQARPGAAFEERIGAGAHQERALQRGDGAVDRADRGERPEIAPRPRLRAAMLQDLRRPVIAGDQDVGKRLVVAQQHVEARPQLLDQIGFEQQRLGLGGGRDDLDRSPSRRSSAQSASHGRSAAHRTPAASSRSWPCRHRARRCRRSASGRRRARSARAAPRWAIAARPTASGRRRPARRSRPPISGSRGSSSSSGQRASRHRCPAVGGIEASDRAAPATRVPAGAAARVAGYRGVVDHRR